MHDPRSYLFVPGDRPERFAKAVASKADAVIFDWEDAVAPDNKQMARDAVVDWFGNGRRGIVRINGSDTNWFDADLAAVLSCTDAVVMLPKASLASRQIVSDLIPRRSFVMLIETVEGLVEAKDIASGKGVVRLAFGNLDFAADAGFSPGGAGLDHARLQIALASRYHNLPPPIDGVTVALDDAQVLEDDIAHGQALGFGAKLCIHPKQVAAVNQAYSPSPEEVAWARRIVAAIGGSADEGVVQIDGKMVDKPVINRARTILRSVR